jgi:hypothetical protein
VVKLVGLLRARAYSPGRHADNDRIILMLTAARLEERGAVTQVVREEDVGSADLRGDAIFSMVQGPEATERLAAVERGGVLIVNSPRAVSACWRENLCPRLLPTGSFPESRITSTAALAAAPPRPAPDRPLWIKRTGVHAIDKGDVVLCRSRDEVAGAAGAMRERGIGRAVVQHHVHGDVIKFYGVAGTPFFRWYREADPAVSPAAFARARILCARAAGLLDLVVYGGDAVIAPDGRICLIDVNDWPSFASFREDAAQAIASALWERTQHEKPAAVGVR